MDLDRILPQALVVQGITVFREIDVLKGTDDETNVLWKDRSVAGETGSFACRICGIEDLCC